MKRALMALTVVLMLGPALLAQDQATMDAVYRWKPSVKGSPAVIYVVQVRVDGGPWATVMHVHTNEVKAPLELLKTYEIRVAGVDAKGRQGPWSKASDPYKPSTSTPSGCMKDFWS